MSDFETDIIYNVKVNRTGKIIPVYESTALGAPQIGSIYPNEVFTVETILDSERKMYSIRFRNSAGQMTVGVIYAGDNDENVAENLNIHHYAKFTEEIEGKTYYGFEMRRYEEVYNGSAVYLRLIGQGLRVLTDSSKSGATRPHWIRIRYVETNVGTGKYVEVKPGQYVYMDLGYDKGSTFTSNCSLIGSL